MDEADVANDRAEVDLAEAIKKARTNVHHPDWSGSCWCGLIEWTTALQPHFCGVDCRDLYERESRMKRINGR